MIECYGCDSRGWVVYEEYCEYAEGNPDFLGYAPEHTYDYGHAMQYLSTIYSGTSAFDGESVVICDDCDGWGVEQ